MLEFLLTQSERVNLYEMNGSSDHLLYREGVEKFGPMLQFAKKLPSHSLFIKKVGPFTLSDQTALYI